MKQRSPQLLFLALRLSLMACCLGQPACEPVPPEGTGGVQVEEVFGANGRSCGRGIAVLMTDYASTNVGLIGLDGATLSGSFISSASADPTLNAPLAGDVDFPTTRMSGDVILLDRLAVSVLTAVDVSSAKVTRQVSVRTGFESNPQDLVPLDDGSVLVSRLERNRNPGQEKFDEGDDLLRLFDGEILERIDLSAFADPITERARPGSMVRDEQHIYLSLTRHDAAFEGAGEAAILILDGANGSAIEARPVVGMKNCAGLAFSPSRRLLATSCGGLVNNANSASPEDAGIVVFSVDAQQVGAERKLSEVYRLEGDDLGYGPPTPSLSFASEDALWVGTYGAIDGEDAGRPDRVLSIDLDSGRREVQVESSEEAFTLGDIRCVSACGVCFVADAGRGVVHRFALSGGVVAASTRHRVETEIGLPPRLLGWF